MDRARSSSCWSAVVKRLYCLSPHHKSFHLVRRKGVGASGTVEGYVNFDVKFIKPALLMLDQIMISGHPTRQGPVYAALARLPAPQQPIFWHCFSSSSAAPPWCGIVSRSSAAAASTSPPLPPLLSSPTPANSHNSLAPTWPGRLHRRQGPEPPTSIPTAWPPCLPRPDLEKKEGERPDLE